MKHLKTILCIACLSIVIPAQAATLFHTPSKSNATTTQNAIQNDRPASYQNYLDEEGTRHTFSLGLALTNLGSYAEYEFFIDHFQKAITAGFYEYLFSGGARANTTYVGYRHYLNPEPYGTFMGGGVYQTNFEKGADYLFGVNNDDNNPERFFAIGAYFEQGWRIRYQHALATLQYKAGINLSHSVTIENFTSPLFIQLGATIGFGI